MDAINRSISLAFITITALSCSENKFSSSPQSARAEPKQIEASSNSETKDLPSVPAPNAPDNVLPAKEMPTPLEAVVESPPIAVEPIDSAAVPPVEIPKCTGDRSTATLVKLLNVSPNPVVLGPGIKVQYRFEVFLKSCLDGTLIALDKQSILYDEDVFADDGEVQYTIYDPADMSMKSAGKFDLVLENKDLFGNKGAGFAYFRSLEVSLPPARKSLIVEIETSRITNIRTPELNGYKVFLSVGESEPAVELIMVK